MAALGYLRAAFVFGALVLLPTILFPNMWVWFWLMLVGLPATLAALPREKDTAEDCENWQRCRDERTNRLVAELAGRGGVQPGR